MFQHTHNSVMPSRVPPPGDDALTASVRRTYAAGTDFLGEITPEEVAAIAHLREWTHLSTLCPLCGRLS